MSKIPKNLFLFLEKTGLTLDANNDGYQNNDQKLHWHCPKGCTFVSSWRTLNKKGNCLVCSNKNKNSYDEVKTYLAATGASLLTARIEYENGSTQKLDILCPKGHQIQKSYKAYKNNGCSICRPRLKKYDISDLKKIAESRGDTLLSTKYINAYVPLLFKCKNPDHEPYTSLWTTYNRNNLRTKGQYEKTECRKCAYEKLKISLLMLKKQILQEKYSILDFEQSDQSDQFFHSKHIIKFQCGKNHKPYVTNWSRWQQGKRCPYCSPYSLKTTEEIKKSLDSNGLVLIEGDGYQYTGNKAPMKAMCKEKNHITWSCLQAFEKYGCRECSTAGTSSAEIWLKNYFSEFNPIHRHKLKTKYESIELDIYFPSHNLAIEYCGLYWHGSKHIESLFWDDPDELSFKLNKSKYRHQIKKQICNENGINLLTIFEDEFMTKRDVVVSRIGHKLGVTSKVYARKCDMSEITKEEAKEFFNSYHLQNNTPFEFGLKLTYSNEIVASMTFEKPLSKSNSENGNMWELKRYCTTTKFQIVGGAQRLFKHATDEARKRNLSSILTFCDLRWGNGGVYKSLGFTLIQEISEPSPHVIKGMSRIRTRHIDNENVIYDCGHQKWLFNL